MQQVVATQVVRAGIMMEGRGNLDQALKKHFLGIPRLEPNLFPMFVSVVKTAGIEGFKSFLKQPISCLWIHGGFPVEAIRRTPSKA